MKNKNYISVVVVITLLSLATVGYIVYRESYSKETDEISLQQMEQPSDNQFSNIEDNISNNTNLDNEFTAPLVDKVNIQSMSLPYLMHSAVYNQGEVMEEKTSSFGWNGDMQITINSAQIKDYDAVSDEVTFESWDLYLDMFEEPKVLLLDVSLENINAQKPSGVKYEFSMQMFSLALESDFYSENYNNAEYFNVFLEEKSAFEAYCSVHGQGDDYYTFELPEGETLDFQLAFLIDSSLLDTEEQLLLALGTTSRATDAILLDNIS